MIPTVQITPIGPVAPSREDIEAGLWSMFRDAFGIDLNEDARSPQGQLVTSLTAALMRKDNTIIEALNQFDPRYAFGVYQEGLGAVYFMTRHEATSSVAMVEFTGLDGAVIPSGTVLLDEANSQWIVDGTVTIGVDGTATAQVTCAEVGDIPAAAGSITGFLQTIDGVDRVSNSQPAVRGRDTETRDEYEERRIRSVAANSKNTNNSVRGAVLNVTGVIDAYAIDNRLPETVYIGATNYPMPQHSLLTVVVGGNDKDIAEQILIKGGTGCTFVGNTHYRYEDIIDPEATAKPVYDVYFLRPEHVRIYFKVLVRSTAELSLEAEAGIKNSITSQFASGKNAARIAGMVVGNDFICGIDARVIDIEVSTDDATWVKYIQMGVDQYPVTHEDYITVDGL